MRYANPQVFVHEKMAQNAVALACSGEAPGPSTAPAQRVRGAAKGPGGQAQVPGASHQLGRQPRHAIVPPRGASRIEMGG